MTVISQEIEAVRRNEFKLQFKIPTARQLAELRRIHRDRSEADHDALRRVTEGLEAFLEAYEKQEIDLYDIPPALRTRLMAKLREDLQNGDS
jgi:superfamily I DNA and RNA helicase